MSLPNLSASLMAACNLGAQAISDGAHLEALPLATNHGEAARTYAASLCALHKALLYAMIEVTNELERVSP